jgi:hypothetical protein
MADTELLLVQLNTEEQLQLVGLTNHPGWRVLQKLMEGECQRVSREVIKSDSSNEKDIARLQFMARATNSFCANLIKTVSYHINSVLYKEPEEIEEEFSVLQ